MNVTKQEKLQHYAEKDLTEFVQYDGFIGKNAEEMDWFWRVEEIIAYRRGFFHAFANVVFALEHGTSSSSHSYYLHHILHQWFLRGDYSPPPDLPLNKGHLHYSDGYWVKFPEDLKMDDLGGEIEGENLSKPEDVINSLLASAEMENLSE